MKLNIGDWFYRTQYKGQINEVIPHCRETSYMNYNNPVTYKVVHCPYNKWTGTYVMEAHLAVCKLPKFKYKLKGLL